MSKTIYYDRQAGRRINSAGMSDAAKPNLRYQEYVDWSINVKDYVGGVVSAADLSDCVVFRAAVDTDFLASLVTGALAAGYSGAVTAIRVDGLGSAAPPSAGVIHLTNGAGDTESIAYDGITANGTGDYTFSVNATLTYIYLNNDVASYENTAPCVRVLDADIDDTDKATGVIVVTLDADTATFLNALDGEESVDGYFELAGLNSSARTVFYMRIPITLQNILDPNTGAPGAPVSNYHTKIELAALLFDKADKVGAADLEITDSAKGYILKDRTTGNRCRLFVDNGIIGIEEII